MKNSESMGPLGPISLGLAGLLLIFAPLIRGGNRSVALIALELLAMAIILLLAIQRLRTPAHVAHLIRLSPLSWLFIASPILFGLLHLLPIPFSTWVTLPGRGIYEQTLSAVGVPIPDMLPISISPAATRISLYAALPLVAAFLLAMTLPADRIKRLLNLLVWVALGQAILGLLQIASGPGSALYFGLPAIDAIGTFASRNNYANFLSMILPIALFFTSRNSSFGDPSLHEKRIKAKLFWWIALCLVLVLALFASRSRTGLVTGLTVGLLALMIVYVTGHRSHGARFAIGLSLLLIVGGVALIGLDMVMTRFASDNIRSDTAFRGLLAQSSMAAAWEYWPLGSGLGTYESAYARFQPPEVAGYAEHAHNDYAQLLLEGGLLAAILMLVAGAAFARQAVLLVREVRLEPMRSQDALLSLLSGLGLAALLLHSIVDYHMRIPANAIVACFLAGVFLRPSASSIQAAVSEVRRREKTRHRRNGSGSESHMLTTESHQRHPNHKAGH